MHFQPTSADPPSYHNIGRRPLSILFTFVLFDLLTFKRRCSCRVCYSVWPFLRSSFFALERKLCSWICFNFLCSLQGIYFEVCFGRCCLCTSMPKTMLLAKWNKAHKLWPRFFQYGLGLFETDYVFVTPRNTTLTKPWGTAIEVTKY